MERRALRRNIEELEEDPGSRPDKVPEVASDVEMAIFLAGHLDKPCGMEVAPGKRVTLLDFYVREAKNALTTMTNPWAREFLNRKLKEVEGK